MFVRRIDQLNLTSESRLASATAYSGNAATNYAWQHETQPMFSGIVEEVGTVQSYDLTRMTIRASKVLENLQISESRRI